MNFNPRFYQSEAIESIYPLVGRKLIAMPTGAGKSYVAAQIALDSVPFVGRILFLAHVRKLISQNAASLLHIDPLASLGVVCAGLRRDELAASLQPFLGVADAEITVASVQSIYRRLDYWRDVGLILIDEAHRITPVGGRLYTSILQRFPGVPVVGLTATPFRPGTGFLHSGEHKIFDEKCYEISHAELVEMGYLVPFATKGSDLAFSAEGLRKTGDEYSQTDLDNLIEDGAKTRRIVKQFIQRARERNHWLIFAINIRHAKMIRNFLEAEGISAGVIYDGMKKEGLKYDDEIALFEMGIHRALINVNCLTTGYDFRPLDCIGLFRPIASPVNFIQCIGRVTRLSPETGKVDGLVLDYGGNVARHGDFSMPTIKEAKSGKRTKQCKSCGEFNFQSARYCAACNFRFDDMFKTCPKCTCKVDRSAQTCSKCGYGWPVNETNLDEDGKTLIQEKAVWIDLDTWKAKAATPWCKPGEDQRPNYVLIDYKGIDGVKFKEYIFPESDATRPRFNRFWQEHKGKIPYPISSADAAARFNELRLPRRVKAVRKGQYIIILAREH